MPRTPPDPVVQEPREGFTALGRVLRTHGVRGELRVQPFQHGAPNLQRGRRIWVAEAQYTITAARPDREAWLLTFDRIRNREEAEALRGGLIEAPDASVLRADDESYFVHEIIGLEVVTDAGLRIGRIVDVLQPGANDVYVVEGPYGEVLIPAIGDVVQRIDVSAGEVHITPLDGLLDVPQ
ncbi:MAG: ribosome maturation factor RimM [Tepidiformaceae bacterium]